ncbi:MAG: ribonuclease P protein component [Limisphaerales bacterium]|tara:strand:- start:386 stop:748 length:363 start_codon:yes stop_codon:yes gene_type:complete
MNPPARLRLTRAMRLRHRADFARLKQQGHRLAKGCLVLNWQELPPGSSSRFAVITTRKLGKAVIRNRCRRLVRECVRLHQHVLRVPVDMVLIARASIVGQSFATVERDYLRLLREAALVD